MPLIFKHLCLFIQKEFQLRKLKNSFFTYRFICIVVFLVIQFHMMVNRHHHQYTTESTYQKNSIGYLESKNYTIYWSSNRQDSTELKNLSDNLIKANSDLGKLFSYEESSPNITLKYFDNKMLLEIELNKCQSDPPDTCSNVLFGLFVKHYTNRLTFKKNYTIFLLDKKRKEDIYLLGNIKYATMLSLLQKNNEPRSDNNIPYIFLYDVTKGQSLTNNLVECAKHFLNINYYYQLFSSIFIISSVHNIVNQRNGLLKKYLHNIGVSRFTFFGSCIVGPLVEMVIFFTISGAILLEWGIPEFNMSLVHFVIWKISYSVGAMGSGVIFTSLCGGKKDILVTIIFWMIFIHLDIGQTVGLTSDSMLTVFNINMIDKNLARLHIESFYEENNIKSNFFPLEIKYDNEFFGTIECQLIWLALNIFFCYGVGIIVDMLWPNDSYSQFSFLYYIRLFRNYAYVKHIFDKDDFRDLNKAIQDTNNGRRRNVVKKQKEKGFKYKKMAIVGEHVSKLYKGTGETALEDVSFAFKSNEINVVIGFNESGLPTLMEILAGASAPSKGRMTYFNKTLKTFGRHRIGYCPHYTVTYTGMTVEMALKVFSIIKNNQYQRLNSIKKEHLFMNYDVELLVETLGLIDYMDINCENLPEKVQLYLNLCMAFVGNPKIVILNGILDKLPNEDVVKIIGILKDIKEDRTIILSTQDMEIADQLADHVLLLKKGKVLDEGPFQELKKIHCAYAKLDIRLKRSLISDDRSLPKIINAIHKFVKSFIPEAVIEETHSYGNHLVLRLPQDTKYCFGILLDNLESRAKEFNIIDLSIHNYSLEDSFLLSNIGATLEPGLQKSIDLINRLPGFDDRASGFTLYTIQLFALIRKRFSYLFIDMKTLFFVVSIAILMAVALPEFLRNYAVAVCPLQSNRTAFEKIYIPMYDSKKSLKSVLDAGDDIKGLEHDKKIKKLGKYPVKYCKVPQNYIFWRRQFPIKVSPIVSNHQSIITTSLCSNVSLSLMDNLMNLYSNEKSDYIQSEIVYLKSDLGNGTDTTEVDNNGASIMKFISKKVGINWDVLIPTSQIIMMCIVTYFLTAYSLFIERVKGFKQQQYYAGVSPFLYWISNFIADTILGIIVFSLLIALFGLLDVNSSFLPFFKATSIYFFMNLPIFYCLTFFGKTFFNIFGLVGIFIISLQGLLCIFLGKTDFTEDDFNEKNMKYVWGMIKTHMNPFTFLYKVQIAQHYGNEDDKIKASHFINPILGLPITFVYILLIFGFLILMECGFFTTIINWIKVLRMMMSDDKKYCRSRRRSYESNTSLSISYNDDEDNINMDEFCHLSTIRTDDEPTIIFENAKPYLRDINLQTKLNFDVFPGECFCWYIKDDNEREGIFNFMTGNIKKKKGFIMVNDKDVNKRMTMGYSPSKDILLPFYTPFEHYQFFALLSGFRKSKLQAINMLNLTGLIQYRHKQVEYCDPNQKRRLVVGIAALTQSGALFLDTPTEYLQKQGRIEIWELINSLLIEKEESIIITTNNLEECNELSSRFGFIENGFIDYTGTYTGLQKKYCDGFNFKITVSNPSLEVLICLDQIMVGEFDAIPADLTQITPLMEWDVPKVTKDGKVLSWSEMYAFGEKLFLRYGKLILPPQQNSNENGIKKKFNSSNLRRTDSITTSTEDSRTLEEGINEDEDEGDKVSGYGGIRSNVTVPHIIDYVITNNSLEQIIFKIQNSNL